MLIKLEMMVINQFKGFNFAKLVQKDIIISGQQYSWFERKIVQNIYKWKNRL